MVLTPWRCGRVACRPQRAPPAVSSSLSGAGGATGQAQRFIDPMNSSLTSDAAGGAEWSEAGCMLPALTAMPQHSPRRAAAPSQSLVRPLFAASSCTPHACTELARTLKPSPACGGARRRRPNALCSSSEPQRPAVAPGASRRDGTGEGRSRTAAAPGKPAAAAAPAFPLLAGGAPRSAGRSFAASAKCCPICSFRNVLPIRHVAQSTPIAPPLRLMCAPPCPTPAAAGACPDGHP